MSAIAMSATDRTGVVAVDFPLISMAGPVFVAVQHSWIRVEPHVGVRGTPMISRHYQDAVHARLFVVRKGDEAERLR